MPHPLVGYVPVEQRLELVATVGADGVDPEWEPLNHVVDEVDGVLLGVPVVNLERADAGGVIDRRVLKPPDPSSALCLEIQEGYVDLDVMAGNLLFVAVSVNGTPTSCATVTGVSLEARGC